MAIGFLSPVPFNNGLTLITAQDFSTQSTIDVTGCFSATYSNYYVTLNITTASLTNYALFQFLNGTTPATSAYYWSYMGLRNDNQTALNAFGSNQASVYFSDYDSSNYGASLSALTFFNPNKSSATAFTSDIIWAGNTQSTRRGGGIHTTSQAYTGLRVVTNSGTITGTIRVYGLRDS